MLSLKDIVREERGMATPLLLLLAQVVIVGIVMLALVIPAFAGQQAKEVEDEMQATANYVAAAVSTNRAGTQIDEAYLVGETSRTGSLLLSRPATGDGWGNASNAVGQAYVPSIALDRVQEIQPGQAVPGAVGLTARSQGVAITFTMQVALLHGLVHSTVTHTVWAVSGNI